MGSTRQDPAHRSDGPEDFERVDLARPRWLSILIPAKDEAACLPELVEEVARAFRPLVERDRAEAHRLDGFETIVVDDGSTDDTPRVLNTLRAAHPELRPLTLTRNVGQSAALAAGFWAARGEWVGILDADLQNPPSELARLWDALPGHDAALGWRVQRRDVWWKRALSRVANAVRNRVLGQSIRDTGCSVRIFRRGVARRLPMFNGAHRFFGPLLLREGCSVVQAPVAHRPRPHGSSHYNFWNRSTKVVADLVGVAWLMRRPVRAAISRTDSKPATAPPAHLDARPVAARQEA